MIEFASSTDPFHCMEIRGGCGTSRQHFCRPGLEVWVSSHSGAPADAGGGDLHLLSSCASGRITRMLLADVSAFDSAFREIAVELRELMKRNVNTLQHARIVREVSGHLELAAQKGAFASTLIGTYFAPTRSLVLCNAGHPPPLLYRAQEARWSILKQRPAKSPSQHDLTGVVDPGEYQEFKTKLAVGDMVLCYSNSVTECRTATRHTIGVEGLVSRVSQLHSRNFVDLPSELIAHLRQENEKNLESEDATLVLCRATTMTVGWKNNLLAPFRLLGGVSDQTRFVRQA